MRRALLWLALPSAAAWAGCSAGTHCDASGLAAALGDARPGETVSVGACRVGGRFVVPAGVSLRGEGVGRSVIVAPATASDDALAEPVIELSAGAREVGIADLTIEATLARAGLLLRGDGGARIERVHVEGGAQLGIGAEALRSLVITDTTVDGARGAVPSEGDEQEAEPRNPSEVGLAVVRCAAVELTNVTITRAVGGAVLLESSSRWVGGGAAQCAGSGVLVDGGDATLEGLDLSETSSRDGIAAGVLFRAGATGSTIGLEIVGGAGLGIVQDGSAAVAHSRPEIRSTRLAGVWAQRSPLDVSGIDASQHARIEGTSFAGIVAVEPASVSLSYLTISGVGSASMPVEGDPVAGDALQIVLGAGLPRITLTDVRLEGGDRAALVLDADAELPNVRLDDVAITCSALGRSAVRQNDDGTVEWPGGPPAGGDLCANELPMMPLDVAALIEADELPSAAAWATDGLAGLLRGGDR